MKKFIALILSLLITLSAGMPTAVAGYYEDNAVVVAPVVATPLYAQEVEATVAMPTDHGDFAGINLAEGTVVENTIEESETQRILPNGIQLFSENALDAQESISKNLLQAQRGGGPSASGVLGNVGESAQYTLEVDHDLFPKIIIGFYRYCTVNDFEFEIHVESTQRTWKYNTSNGSNPYLSKRFISLSKAEGGIETYTITITSSLPVTGYAFIVSTPDTFIDDFSGLNSFVTVAKNTPPQELRDIGLNQIMKGYQSLLNGDGEWFHYIADGETYITAGMPNWNHLAFEVYDVDTGLMIYQTNESDDNVVEILSDSLYEGYVQKRLDLEPGKDYWIRFYSTVFKQSENLYSDTYNIWMGVAIYQKEGNNIHLPVCVISPNVQKTFTFELSGYPESMRADSHTLFYFTGESKNVDARITFCQITTPNGYSFLAPMGNKGGISKIELDNYLSNPNNAHVNGTWKITAKVSRSTPNLRFAIRGSASAIVGNDGN